VSTDWYQDVLDFHKKFGCAIGEKPSLPPAGAGVRSLRMKLIGEEFEELGEAHTARDLPEIADALADIIYVAAGMAVTYGIDLRPVFDAVHASNMAKEGGATRADGKILKPPGWTPPDVAGLLRKQGWEGK
jgi:predicted HAD superfamily Cof-like phosphohydrolase